MWRFTLDGMLSIVRHRDYEDTFLVRSRSSEILERIFPDYPIICIEDADYRYRIVIHHGNLLGHLIQEIMAILEMGYTNFKDECQQIGNPEYLDALLGVWKEMYDYQSKRESEPRRS